VFPITNAENRSGRRVAAANRIGPPQSCTISVMSRRSSASMNRSITCECSEGRKPKPAAGVEKPKPGRSGAMHRNRSRRPAITSR
jgi:hypothetical protein